MKKILTLILISLCITSYSQESFFKKVDKNTSIIKRDCEFIVISSDTTLQKALIETTDLIEYSDCFNATNKKVCKIFFFELIDEECITKIVFNNKQQLANANKKSN